MPELARNAASATSPVVSEPPPSSVTIDHSASISGNDRRRAVAAAVIGHFVEYYDYTVYGYFAVVIGSQFFPAADPTVSLMAAFAAFALAFVARPVGGLVFGHFGDRLGRRNVLAMSVLLMGLGSLVIGVLPTYAVIGVWAPILLLLARMLQGFSTGGENAGSVTFLAEYAPIGRRGLYTSWQFVGLVLALLAGSGVGALLNGFMPEDAFAAWGWRIPFLLGAALAVVGLYLRLRLEDTPAFQRLESGAVEKAPIAAALTTHWRAVLICLGFFVSSAVAVYVLLIYMPTYTSTVFGLPKSQALLSNTISLVALLVLIPLLGSFSDRFGRKRLLLAFNGALVVFSYPLILLISQGTFTAVLAAQLLFAVLIAFFFGPGNAMVAELFPTSVRYTGFGLGSNVSLAVFGGTAPFAATWLLTGTGSATSPAIMLIVAGAISFVVVALMRETSHVPLR